MKFQEIAESEEQFQLATYAKMNIAAERGEGVWLYTSEGDKYLDLYGGHAVCAPVKTARKRNYFFASGCKPRHSHRVFVCFRAGIAEKCFGQAFGRNGNELFGNLCADVGINQV